MIIKPPVVGKRRRDVYGNLMKFVLVFIRRVIWTFKRVEFYIL